MEVYGKSMVAAPANVIYMSSILGRDGPNPVHKNMYRCKLTGLTHICDKNCNQRILYDNHSSLCRASGQIFPLTPAEEQAVRGCGFKRRRDAQFHTSPFERSFSAVSPICSQVGDGMDMS
ncbi:hypothetical protein Ahy_A10g048802 isoform A [Arachis hypogaea]|uniref:Uncharacterized protein n=1 Tax=Arachis hypogaea TaxID=3818 RepID=A0A445B5Z2_ARAHY|nr:hypothetical protein Ahy_A10g048802 isoform A [Arachis hypogaea]